MQISWLIHVLKHHGEEGQKGQEGQGQGQRGREGVKVQGAGKRTACVSVGALSSSE
jgi:hypothetical protein